jgi:CRISPR type I-E-associated protein CasB/Cse2
MSAAKWDVELVDHLTELANPDSSNRATLAHLRRGLDRPLDYTLGRVGWLFRRVPDFALADVVLAAGLFAWVRGDCRQDDNVSFGAAFGAELTLDEKQQRENRFIDLLDTVKEELPYKLRQAITLIGRDRVGLDWVLFIKHLNHWEHESRWVQKDWARGFWAVATVEDVEPTAAITQPVSV